MLFNNPNFQPLQNSATESSMQRQSRLSVQEIMQKYDNTNKKPTTNNQSIESLTRTTFGKPVEDQRFTFQTEMKQNTSNERPSNGTNQLQGYRLSYGQQINNQPRDSNLQLLKSIDESNLSKVLSEFSILTEDLQEEKIDQNQNIVFQNPIGLHTDVNPQRVVFQNQGKQYFQQQLLERITFGQAQQQTNQMMPSPKPVQTQPQQLFHNNVFQSINIGTESQNMSYTADDELFDDMSVLRDKVLGLLQAYSNDLKQSQNLKQIKQKVKLDASVIAQEYSQVLEKVNQTDISALSIMESQSPMYTQKKEKELNSMFNLVEQFLKKFNDGVNLSYSNIMENKEKDVEKKQAFKEEKENIPMQNPQRGRPLDISILPNFPHSDDSFYLQQSIPVDKLTLKLKRLKDQLQQELDKTQLHYTKEILIEMIQNLNEILKANESQTIKTVVYRIEEGIKKLNLEDQGSLDLYNYMAKAIKATKKRLNEVDVNMTETKDPKKEKLLKRKFFDIALKIKNNLPLQHPGKQIMVSQLYEIFERQQISQENLEEFLKIQLIGQQ